MNELTYDELWLLIKDGNNEALSEMILRFEPLIRSQSTINGYFNEDIAQEIRLLFIKAIKYKSFPKENHYSAEKEPFNVTKNRYSKSNGSGTPDE